MDGPPFDMVVMKADSHHHPLGASESRIIVIGPCGQHHSTHMYMR